MRPVLARLRGPAGEAVLHDALADDGVCAALLEAIGAGREFATQAGTVRGLRHRRLRGAARPAGPAAAACRAGRRRRATRWCCSAGGCC